jgi:general secretion pathway protein H
MVGETGRLHPLSFQQGFTLLEIIVVMVIAVLALALIVPNFGGVISSVQIKGAARDLASGLRYARGQALANKTETALTLDVEQRRYRIGDHKREYSLPSELDLTLFTARSELKGEGVGAITFFPDGTSTGGRITLVSGDRQYIVDVNWLTGRVDILD